MAPLDMRCGAREPTTRGLLCGLAPLHDGPHGWDAEARIGEEADRATYQTLPPPAWERGAADLQLDGPWDWWLTPVRKQLATAAASIHKPLAEVTMDEVVSWGIIVGYGYLVGALLGRVIQRLVA
jgi:hypothetical protein